MVIGDVIRRLIELLQTEKCISAHQHRQKRHKQITEQQFPADGKFHGQPLTV